MSLYLKTYPLHYNRNCRSFISHVRHEIVNLSETVCTDSSVPDLPTRVSKEQIVVILPLARNGAWRNLRYHHYSSTSSANCFRVFGVKLRIPSLLIRNSILSLARAFVKMSLVVIVLDKNPLQRNNHKLYLVGVELSSSRRSQLIELLLAIASDHARTLTGDGNWSKLLQLLSHDFRGWEINSLVEDVINSWKHQLKQLYASFKGGTNRVEGVRVCHESELIIAEKSFHEVPGPELMCS
ncbi:hypothetical protein Tco_0418884 [Tanacetum coccineum]